MFNENPIQLQFEDCAFYQDIEDEIKNNSKCNVAIQVDSEL